MLVPRLFADGIVAQIFVAQPKLSSQKTGDLLRYDFSGRQRSTGKPQHAKLEGKTKLIACTSPLPDVFQVFIGERVVLQQV